MKRAKWKGPFLGLTKIKHKKTLPILFRSSEVTSNLIGQTVNISNGKTFISVTISEDMIGHKFGEFVTTRAKFEFKKKKKKK